jgi:beta-galactosidase
LRPDGREYPILDGMRHWLLYWVKSRLPTPVLRQGISVDPVDGVEILIDVGGFDWSTWEEQPETVKTALALRERSTMGILPMNTRGVGILPMNPGRDAHATAALVRIKVGLGDVYLCQLPVDPNRPEAVETARQLLHNLGFRLERTETLDQATSNVDAEGFIRSWLIAGPFTVENATETLLASDFLSGEAEALPAPGEKAGGNREWKTYFSPGYAVDFEAKNLFGWNDRVIAYAAVYIYSPWSAEELSAQTNAERIDLLFGSDDGCRVWLNSELLYDDPLSRPLVVDNVRIEGLKLQKGWNRLLFKVEDQVWDWKLCARLVDRTGAYPSGILVSPRKIDVQ